MADSTPMCFVVAAGWFVPRLVLIALWFLDWTRSIDPWWLGILGWFAMPYTTLTYVCIQHYSGDTTSLGAMVLMTIAVLLDLGVYGGSRRRRRKDD